MLLMAHKIKTGTQKQRLYVAKHMTAYYSDLSQCYASPSEEKRNAFLKCRKKFSALNGFDFKINSFNGWRFEASFLFADPENGDIKLYTITKERDYVCDYILKES